MADQPASRRSILTVWHWPKWILGVMIALMPAAYFLSTPVVFVIAHDRYLDQPFWGRAITSYIHPAVLCASKSRTLRIVWNWDAAQAHRLLKLFVQNDNPPPRVVAQHPDPKDRLD